MKTGNLYLVAAELMLSVIPSIGYAQFPETSSQSADERCGGVEPEHRDTEHRQRVRIDPDELERNGRIQPAPVPRVGMATKQQQLDRETQIARQFRPGHEADFPRQQREREAEAEQRGGAHAAPARRQPQDRDGGEHEPEPQQADADHAAAIGECNRNLKLAVHVDIGTAASV